MAIPLLQALRRTITALDRGHVTTESLDVQNEVTRHVIAEQDESRARRPHQQADFAGTIPSLISPASWTTFK